MIVFDMIKNKNIDELVDWIDEHFAFDSAPYWYWWDKNYCSKCETIASLDDEGEFAYCEVHNNCRFFKDMDKIPDTKQIIKMWLLSEVKCTDCKHFVGCECFDGEICSAFKSNED